MEYWSQRPSTLGLDRLSGAMYRSACERGPVWVNETLPNARATPKSQTYAQPESSIITLAGFTSRNAPRPGGCA